jgi:molecular chaperone GrpE
MSERDREGEEAGPHKVKVTDKRRVRAEEIPPAPEASAPDRRQAGIEAAPTVGAEASGSEGSELEAAQREAAEYKDHLMRLKAEFDNYRKRVLREQTQAIEMASEPLVQRLLEVLDDFELALMAGQKKPDYEAFLHGVELVYAKLVDGLRAAGLEKIHAEGEPFDPERHEALMGSGDTDGEPVVADVLRQGYTLKGRVIRAAGVRIEHRK